MGNMDSVILINFGKIMIVEILGISNNSQVMYLLMFGGRINGMIILELMIFDLNNESIVNFQYVLKYDLELMIFICVLIVCVIVFIVIGNVFVILVIILEKSL